MPTFHDETLQERYQREHLSALERYAAMSPLQIEALDIARHNAEAQRDELLAELKARVKNDEQSAFEDWLRITCPSGDVESVQRQWEESSLYSDFLADTEKARAIIEKAEAA